MKRLAALALVGTVAALSAGAAMTNVVDVAALVDAVAMNAASTNGWEFFGFSTNDYPYAYGLRFNAFGDCLLSPDFGASILRLEFNVRCSNDNPTRRLLILNAEDDGQVAEITDCESSLTLKSFDFEANDGLSRFKIQVGGSGSTGAWGIGGITVVTTERLSVPAGLAVVQTNAASCTLAWTNGEGCVSNRVDAYRIERVSAGETVLLDCGFDTFSAGGKPDLATYKLTKMDPALSGVRVYAATNSKGICQISTGKESGFIRHSGFADYTGMSLRLLLKRYPGDHGQMQIAYELDGSTNVFAAVGLSDEFKEEAVGLSSLPNGAAILIGYDVVKSNRRVLVDRMSFVRTGTENLTPIGSCWVVAAAGRALFPTSRRFTLPAQAECRFEVCAANADGAVSRSLSVDVRLTGDYGMYLWLQ